MAEKDDSKFLETALTRYKACEKAMKANIDLAKDDLEFVYGDGKSVQWPEKILKEREGRPSLTINKLPVYIRQVVNDQRQNQPAIKIRGFDSVKDPTTAKVLNGLIRHIQNNSDSKIAFDTGCAYAVRCGLGYIRILTKYIDDVSFDQEIVIDRISNPLSVLAPIHLCQKADWSDAPYMFVLSSMPKDEYKEKYKDNPEEWPKNENINGWVDDDNVRLVEYFITESSPKTLYMYEDGTVTETPIEGLKPKKTRRVRRNKVTWYLISANKIIESKPVAGQWIPVVPVLGEEVNVAGKKYYISLIRNSKDAQRHYNYFKSAETERIALAPIAPWVGAEGQFEGHEDEWDTAHKVPTGRLEYKPTTLGAQLVPPPQRAQPTQIDTAVVNALRGSNDDIKATTGMFDASLGAKGNESSGRAIIARERQGDTSTYHFIDNTIVAMKHCGRIMVDMIPEIYDTERSIRILGDDMADSVMEINTENGGKLATLQTSLCDVVVDVGPNYTTRRIEAAETLVRLAGAIPVLGQMAPDIIARNMDFAEAKELAARLKATVPPEIIAASDQEAKGFNPQQQMNPQMIQKMVADLQGLSQQLQMSEQQKNQLMQVIGKLQEEIESKDKDRELEMAKTVVKSQTDKEVAEIKVKPEMLAQLLEEIRYIRGRVDNTEQPPSPAPVTVAG